MISDQGAPRKLRLGVAGLGRAFSLMLPTFLADPRIELVSAFDVRASARDRFAADFGASVHSRFDEFAAQGGMDAVYIASPHQFHAEQAAALAARGLHVLVEKPMALTLAQCDAMIAAADAGAVHLIVGHCHSFDTPYLKTRELIRSGRFGAVRMIQATNYTDFLYRPRRPEELRTEDGGGVVFSQAAHQVDVVRLLAGSRPTHVRALTGAWDRARPTEGAYSALMSFENGAFASLTYSGYGHFDSDEWCDWTGEMGQAKSPDSYGQARQRLQTVASPDAEAALKNAGTYGAPDYRGPSAVASTAMNQHFGPIVVSCDGADIRPLPGELRIYGDSVRERIALESPAVPRHEVIDELYAAVIDGVAPLHDGCWARGTLQVCLAMLESARTGREIELIEQGE